MLLERLIDTARSAGDAIMRVYEEAPEASVKSDGSPVTTADRLAEQIILKDLSAIAPDIPVVSEESATSHAIAAPDAFFLVDPLDGTKEFLKRDKKGGFTVNIALINKGEPVLGVVYAPALDRLFAGGRGLGASEISHGTRRKIGIRRCPESGPVAVASASHRESKTDLWLTENLISETISIGSSLKFCLLASGECDVYPRFGPTMEWDTAAGDAVLRAAGGCVKEPEGGPFTYGKADYRNGPFIACGGWEYKQAKIA